MSILLNGFNLDFSSDTFTAYVKDFPKNKGLRDLRSEIGGDWFLHWSRGKLYGIPRKSDGAKPFGEKAVLAVQEHLGVLRARIDDILPSIFSKYEPHLRWPFTFLGKRREMVATIRKAMRGQPEALRGFSIKPRYGLEARIIETHESDVRVALFVQIGTRWEIPASLTELAANGVDLKGLYVIRRVKKRGERRLLGRIGRIESGKVILSESFNGTMSCDVSDAVLEGSREAFAKCLKTLLGGQYVEFERLRSMEEAKLLTGPPVKDELVRMGDFVSKAAPITIAEDLSASVGNLLEVSNHNGYKSVFHAGADVYCFDPARSKRSQYAWTGLEKYGPFDKESFPQKTPRVVVVCTDEDQGRVEKAIRQFRDGLGSDRGPRYAGGLASVFSLVNPSFKFWPVPWVEKKDASIAAAYKRAIEEGLARDTEGFQLGIVAVPDRYAFLPDASNPYLYAKAALLMGGIPVQEARLGTLTTEPKYLQYTFQNMSIAGYAKMGGTPWTIDQDQTVNDEIVLGMGICELSGSRFQERQRHVGITTVFRGDGSYLLASLSRECKYDEYPQVLKESTLNVLEEVKKRNAWRAGDTVRIVFHAQKPLKNVEVEDIVAECVAAVGKEQNVQFAFLTVSNDHSFLVMDTQQDGFGQGTRLKGALAPERGTIVQLGKFTRMVCATGPRLIKRPQTPLPSPLLVHLHPQSTYRDLSYLSEQVLKFTSLSWRSTLPARRPVTIYYSELIAGLLARLRAVPDWSPQILNSKLRASRWFL